MNNSCSQKKTKATAFLYIGLAVLLVLLNLYAYISDLAIAGVQMPQIIPEIENITVRETSTIAYFPRNMILVQVAVIVLSMAYMKISSKEYKIGMNMPEHKVGFVFSVIALVVAVVYAILQLSWESAGYWHIGLVVILGMIANILFMALGTYMFRRAEMGRAAKLLIPMICGMVLFALNFYYEMLFLNLLAPYPFVGLQPMTTTLILIVSGVLLAFFAYVFYLKTNLLSVSIILSLIWGVAVTSFPLSSTATLAPRVTSDLTLALTKLNTVTPIKSYGFTEVVTLLGAIALVATVIPMLVSLLREKGTGFASDEAAGYVPLEPSADEITDCKGLLMSSKTLLLAICSVGALGYFAFSVISDHAIGISSFIADGLDGLFNQNVGAFFLLLAGLVGFVAILALLGSFVIGLFLFYNTRKHPGGKKTKIAWIFTKIFVCGSIALDAIVAILALVLGFGKFLAELPEDLYVWNYLLGDMMISLNDTVLSGAIPGIVFSLIVVLLMLVFAGYHTASLLLVLDFEKNNGEKVRGKFLYKAVYIMTLIFGIAMMLMAPWFYQVLDTCAAMLAGATLLLFASTLRSIAKKN